MSVRLHSRKKKDQKNKNILACGWSQTNCECLQAPHNVAEPWELNNLRILYSRGSWQKATKQCLFNGRRRGDRSPLEGQQAITEGFWGAGCEWEWQVYLHTGQFILRVWSSLSHPRYSYTYRFFKKKNHTIFKNASSQCTFINKKHSLLSQWWLGC